MKTIQNKKWETEINNAIIQSTNRLAEPQVDSFNSPIKKLHLIEFKLHEVEKRLAKIESHLELLIYKIAPTL